MRLALLTALVMVAFAANSILNRMAVGPGHIGATDFALIRAVAGAVTLAALVFVRGRALPFLSARRIPGALGLALYLVGFSLAYLAIDAGIGALILFGGVQVAMFAGAVLSGEAPPVRRWIGAGLAMAGLGWLVWPAGEVALPLAASGAMLAAALGWGIYSLVGRRATDPLAETAANFILAAPLCGVALLALPGVGTPASGLGVALAVLSGAATSGLGYALWYGVLPRLAASVSGLVQLSVPVIAMIGGVLLLGEALTLRMLGAGLLTLGGIAYGLGAFQRTSGSSGS
ncbi:DMT family transporter [Roseibacterium sp. SDUM158016]|uniref:DMT family transporter n=1 Tax=Roseicyclus sediminis TaxID=2980997 RepID=UPI0021CF1AF2|nr:DMT family transporter [Roseibacterium sp. SDUM158016]MCU4654935.1 DMT family transporter [Roseibacterium sp. SDUM158016]